MVDDQIEKASLFSPEFKIGESNDTATIRQLKSLHGVPIAELERKMKPEVESHVGFLGPDESLLDVMALDNEPVQAMGLNHQQLADFLEQATTFADNRTQQYYQVIEIKGRHYHCSRMGRMGSQSSPFADGNSSSTDFSLTNILTGDRIAFSGLLPGMIRKYGFYEGKGTSYRLDPTNIAKTAELIPYNPDDPVVKLNLDRNAEVIVSTAEQISRMLNLDALRTNLFLCPNYRIVPENVDALIIFGNLIKKRYYTAVGGRYAYPTDKKFIGELLTHIDTDHLQPQGIVLGAEEALFLGEIVPSYLQKFGDQITRGISTIYLDPDTSIFTAHKKNKFLLRVFRAVEQRGKKPLNSYQNYLLDLAEKLAFVPEHSKYLFCVLEDLLHYSTSREDAKKIFGDQSSWNENSNIIDRVYGALIQLYPNFKNDFLRIMESEGVILQNADDIRDFIAQNKSIVFHHFYSE